MKKLYSLIAVAAFGLAVNAQNLLTNPGFETGSLAPWAKGTTSSYTEPSVLSSGAHGGTYAVGYTDATATTGFYQNVTGIEAGASYTISFWYKASGDDSDARLWSVYKNASGDAVYTTDGASTDPFRTNEGYLTTASVWTQYTATMPAGDGVSNLDVAVRVYKYGTASFDDFSLTKGTLGTVDFSKDKYSLVKNTSVSDNLFFAKTADVKIINTAGQVVKEVKATEGSSVNISSLPKGMYIVTGTVNGEAVSQKIIKK